MAKKQQDINDILRGEEPTEEFLEELYALQNSSVSDEEIERQAMSLKTELPLNALAEPTYKTSESNFFNLALIIILVVSSIYILLEKLSLI